MDDQEVLLSKREFLNGVTSESVRVGRRRREMSRTMHNAGIALLQRAEQAQPVHITEEHISSLPEIVQQYLRYTGVVGRESIRTVHLKQQGLMRLQPEQKWLPVV